MIYLNRIGSYLNVKNFAFKPEDTNSQRVAKVVAGVGVLGLALISWKVVAISGATYSAYKGGEYLYGKCSHKKEQAPPPVVVPPAKPPAANTNNPLLKPIVPQTNREILREYQGDEKMSKKGKLVVRVLKHQPGIDTLELLELSNKIKELGKHSTPRLYAELAANKLINIFSCFSPSKRQ